MACAWLCPRLRRPPTSWTCISLLFRRPALPRLGRPRCPETRSTIGSRCSRPAIPRLRCRRLRGLCACNRHSRRPRRPRRRSGRSWQPCRRPRLASIRALRRADVREGIRLGRIHRRQPQHNQDSHSPHTGTHRHTQAHTLLRLTTAPTTQNKPSTLCALLAAPPPPPSAFFEAEAGRVLSVLRPALPPRADGVAG